MTVKLYTIRWTQEAGKSLLGIPDTKVQERLLKRAKRLVTDPVKQGEPLKYALSGYYSIIAAERYLVIYTVLEDDSIVEIICVGIHRQGERSDAYKLAEKIIKKSTAEVSDDENSKAPV